LAVYITEAHARNEWPVGNTVSFCDQPTTLAARCELAQLFVNDHSYLLPMAVDTMSNAFQNAFAAWPFRFYIVSNGKLALKAQPDASSFHYHLDEVDEWIEANSKQD
jgi:hypothetical protein